MIDFNHSELSLSTQADLLGLSRSGLYYQPADPSTREIAIKHRIDKIYIKYPFYGSRRITVELRKEMTINRKTVQKYMREMDLVALGPRPNLSKPHPGHKVYPYLLRNVTACYPNHVWGIDITYIPLRQGWMYLAAVLDWYSRYVVSWVLDQTLAVSLVLEAVDQALEKAVPVIWNSDQGSQFTSPQYIQRLVDHGAQISMDGRGRALDNVFTERLWRSVKYEEVYLQDYESPRMARQGIRRYFDFYNFDRPHQGLGYRTPAELYFEDQNQLQFILSEKEVPTLT
jgi:putative transposase